MLRILDANIEILFMTLEEFLHQITKEKIREFDFVVNSLLLLLTRIFRESNMTNKLHFFFFEILVWALEMQNQISGSK